MLRRCKSCLALPHTEHPRLQRAGDRPRWDRWQGHTARDTWTPSGWRSVLDTKVRHEPSALVVPFVPPDPQVRLVPFVPPAPQVRLAPSDPPAPQVRLAPSDPLTLRARPDPSDPSAPSAPFGVPGYPPHQTFPPWCKMHLQMIGFPGAEPIPAYVSARRVAPSRTKSNRQTWRCVPTTVPPSARPRLWPQWVNA